MSFKIASFYKFVALDDLEGLKAAILAEGHACGLIGSVLLAPEGFNAALAGEESGLERFVAWLRRDPRFADVAPKLSDGDRRPFRKLYVKIKRWIIRFADDLHQTPEEIHAGARIAPSEMHDLLRTRPDDVVFVDTRNWYETDYGSFAGAERLPIKRFTQFREAFLERFADQKDKRYVFFCTGGVRCEKVTPWAVNEGFANATQLDGGILKYFEEFGTDGFDGSCFVFDGRWLVDGALQETDDTSLSLRIQPKPL